MNRIQLKVISDSCLVIVMIQLMKSFTYLVQCSKLRQINVLTSSFHMNGHTQGFDPRTQNYLVWHYEQYHMKVLLLKEPSFGGSHAGISSTCLKVRTTLFMYSVINSILRKHCSIALFLNVHLKISFINLRDWKRFVQHNKRKHSMALVGSRRVRTTCTINSATSQFITSVLKLLATFVI